MNSFYTLCCGQLCCRLEQLLQMNIDDWTWRSICGLFVSGLTRWISIPSLQPCEGVWQLGFRLIWFQEEWHVHDLSPCFLTANAWCTALKFHEDHDGMVNSFASSSLPESFRFSVKGVNNETFRRTSLCTVSPRCKKRRCNGSQGVV